MAIPSVVQGTVEFAGKVFEVDSWRGLTWLKSVTSFRFVPTGANKPYTARKESGKGGDYWYGYRKVVGKLHKRYIGKSSELTTAKLEEIAEALNVSAEPRLPKVTQVVTEKVTQVVTDNTAADRLTALELEVQALQKSLETLRSALSGKSEGLGDSLELLKPAEVTDSKLHIKLGNLKSENDNLHQRLAKSQDVIEALNEELATANGTITERDDSIESLKQELAENTRYYTARLNEAGATIGTFKDKLEAAQAKNQRLQIEIGNLQTEREEITQIKKELKEAAAELHREERSLEFEKARWQGQISDAKSELADAKATILAQGNKIRELERGYSFKPNPKESALCLEIGELRSQLETERASREEIGAELSKLKQNSVYAATLSEKLTPDAATLLSQLRAKRKKSPVSLADIEAILEIIEES
jgi:DNA repair exonuclease SbcCD ATPase subunit